jgi:hypothetical protein
MERLAFEAKVNLNNFVTEVSSSAGAATTDSESTDQNCGEYILLAVTMYLNECKNTWHSLASLVPRPSLYLPVFLFFLCCTQKAGGGGGWPGMRRHARDAKGRFKVESI